MMSGSSRKAPLRAAEKLKMCQAEAAETIAVLQEEVDVAQEEIWGTREFRRSLRRRRCQRTVGTRRRRLVVTNRRR